MRIRRTTVDSVNSRPRSSRCPAVARGMSNKEVAGHLFLSVKTVEFHLSHVFHKLGVNSRTRGRWSRGAAGDPPGDHAQDPDRRKAVETHPQPWQPVSPQGRN